MEFSTKYIAYEPDNNGYINYKKDDHSVWEILFERQIKLVKQYAVKEFIDGIALLGLKSSEISQCTDINERLQKLTGWQVTAVKALISAREFFNLLSQKKFPAATFIRKPEQLDYVEEPDIFHELFGHCPMLTNQQYADFLQAYAKKVLTYDEKEWPLLQRFFWFTVEFGLMQTKSDIKAYGGGILSSIAETKYSVESDLPLRVLFEPLQILRTPYTISNLQSIYYVLKDYEQLYNVIELNMDELLYKAHDLGEFPALFKVCENDPNIHINVC